MEWGGGREREKEMERGKKNNEKTYLSSTDNAFVLIVSKTTLIAYPDQCRRAHVWVANRAFAIAFIAQTTNCYPRLFAAHYQIAVVIFCLFLRLVRLQSLKKKKELGWRPAGQDVGRGGTYGWWRDILVACSRWEFCGGSWLCFLGVWRELSWTERSCWWGRSEGGAIWSGALNRKISRTFQFNLSAKTRTSPFCPLADLGDLALFYVGTNSHVI